MVIDTIKRAQIYAELGPRFRKALTYLTTVDVGALAAGTYEIDGRQVYALVQEYQSKRRPMGSGKPTASTSTCSTSSRGRRRWGSRPPAA